MIFTRFFSLAFVGAAIAACAPQTMTNKAAESERVDFAHEVSDLPPDPAITYGTLDNGLRYAVMENATPSQTAALHMSIGTGSINETQAQRGLAHFLEHMAFNGTKNVPEGEMIKRLERFGLSFGADTNASTSFDQTIYKLNLPNVKEEVIDEAFFLMRETVQNMLLEPGAIDRERGVIQSEKRTRDSAGFRRMVDQMSFITPGTGLIERLPIGTDETIATMPAAEFKAYYEAYYHPENTFVVFVGDYPKEQAIAKITQTFADWTPERDVAPPRELAPAALTQGAIGYYRDPEITTSISLSLPRRYVKKPDTAANRRADTVRGLGNAMFSRRLSRIAEQPDAKFLGARASSGNVFDLVEGPSLSLRAAADQWQDALALGEQELRRAVMFGFGQAELDEVLARQLSGYRQAEARANTRPTVGRFGGLVQSITGAFAGERVLTHPSTRRQRFEAIADSVTVEEVWEAFKAEWEGYETPTIYLSTSEQLDDPQQAIKTALLAGQAIAVAPLDALDVGAFAYTDFGPPGTVVADEYQADVDAHLIKFENNVMLNFKQTDFEDKSIRMVVRLGDGALSIPRKDEGLRRLAQILLGTGGLEAHSEDDLATILAGKTVYAQYSLGRAADAFVINGTTRPENIADQMNLMAAFATAPGFREDARQRYLRGLIDWFPTHDATPRSAGARYIPRLIRSGDERFGYSGLESFTAPTTEDVRAWIEPQLKDGVIEITMVGDIDKETAVREVARTFGALGTRKARRGKYPEMTRLTFPAGNDAPVIIPHAGEMNQVMYQVYWPSPDGTNAETRHRLRILRNVLRNRLTKVIREEEAAAYSPSVGLYYSSNFKDYGYMSVSLDLTPEKVKPIGALVMEIAADFQAQNITQDEFDRAIQPVIEDLDASLENNGFWLGALSDAQTTGESLEDARVRDGIYKSMTVEDVKQLAAQVFVDGAAYSVAVVPKALSESR